MNFLSRRYALFTLVGIAGEDDLDAPDTAAPAGRSTGHSGNRAGQGPSRSDNGLAAAEDAVATRRFGKLGKPEKPLHRVPKPILGPSQSEGARDQLLAELESLDSAHAATAWAQLVLPTKNTLTAVDAQRVEDAFQAGLVNLGVGSGEGFKTPGKTERPPGSGGSKSKELVRG